MVYKCMQRNCHFLFERSEEPKQCPDCGYDGICEAAPEEVEEYRKNRERSGQYGITKKEAR